MEPVVGQVGGGVERRRDDLLLAERVVLRKCHDVAGARLHPLGVPAGDVGGGLARAALVLRPRDATVGEIDPPEERRDHLAELAEDEVRILAHLGERVRAQPQEHHLERLSVGVHAEVRARAGGEQHAERVARLGQDR
jgi:hypothetical protein